VISVGENQTLRDQLEVIVVTQVWSDKNLSWGGDSGEISNVIS